MYVYYKYNMDMLYLPRW